MANVTLNETLFSEMDPRHLRFGLNLCCCSARSIRSHYKVCGHNLPPSASPIRAWHAVGVRQDKVIRSARARSTQTSPSDHGSSARADHI